MTDTAIHTISPVDTVVNTEQLTISVTETVTDTQLFTDLVTETVTTKAVTATASVTVTDTVSVTVVAKAKRDKHAERRQVTAVPTLIPSYAWTPCNSETASYVWACLCDGANASTTTVVPWTTITTVVTATATTTDYVTATSTLTDVSTALATITQTETDVVIFSVTKTVLGTVSVSETVTVDVTKTTVFDRTATTFETVTNTATRTQSTDVCAPSPTIWNLRVSGGTYNGQYLAVDNLGYPASGLTLTTTSPATFLIDSLNRVEVPSFGSGQFLTWAPSSESVVAVGTTANLRTGGFPPPTTVCSVSASTGEFTCAGYHFEVDPTRSLLTVSPGTPGASGMRLFIACK